MSALPGGCLLLGAVSALRGVVCSWGVSALGGGVSVLGVCLLWGCVSALGGSALGGVVSQHALRQTDALWTDRCL